MRLSHISESDDIDAALSGDDPVSDDDVFSDGWEDLDEFIAWLDENKIVPDLDACVLVDSQGRNVTRLVLRELERRDARISTIEQIEFVTMWDNPFVKIIWPHYGSIRWYDDLGWD